ncbi:Piwi domain-containing protein [Ferruginibacter sp.]
MININFLPFKNQEFSVAIFRRLHEGEREKDVFYYNFYSDHGTPTLYEIKFSHTEGFEKFELSGYHNTNLIAKCIYNKLLNELSKDDIIVRKPGDFNNKKIHFIIENHTKGKKCVWVEPYYMKSGNLWGLLIDYNFVVETEAEGNQKFKLDKDILIASGTLNQQGNSNVDYYLFKHDYLKKFLRRFLEAINNVLDVGISGDLLEVNSNQLAPKSYLFGNNAVNASSYMGLVKNPPLKGTATDINFYFIYKKDNRDVAVSLLKGLRGETNPSTFAGMAKLFRLGFSNELIKGTALDVFDDASIDAEIKKIKEIGRIVIPIIITNAKKDEDDERLYYWLKHKFTNAGIPCQVVTKDLIRNEYSLKYSLSNIGLQIFAKAGGQPWKMKSSSAEYLILGIGQSYNIEHTTDGNKIEKNITYSVLTDSSGLFRDIKVLGEGVEDENYYNQLITNISAIINGTTYKKVSIHCPFRMSKLKILEKVVKRIAPDLELSVLVINSKSDFFGFDYKNNGLVPFESTYIKLAADEFLVWFEGLQYNNPKITKRFGNPLLIKFWYSNNAQAFKEFQYKESLLQDCINLSGANWRGFKAKQLPVSVFYCQRIAEFIAKFKEYELEHIEISNLKPWFL